MKNLYVGNVSHSTTESELRAVFEAHGVVEKVSMVTDRERAGHGVLLLWK